MGQTGMKALWRRLRALRPPRLLHLGWPRAPAGDRDHGHAPYAAWEAELTAYARWRTGMALTVTFALATEAGWDESIHLARAPAHVEPAEAFAVAELELEHLLMHHRQGMREAALLWHAWARPAEPITLPWPPWDRVALPPAVVREALALAVPGLALPKECEAWPARRREAARWIAAALADHAHRLPEIEARPGLAERLPLPEPPGALNRGATPPPWETVLVALARGAPAMAGVPDGLRPRVMRLVEAREAAPATYVEAVLELAGALARLGSLPPAHQQRPRWLRPMWGRWRHAAALQAALAQLARSPTSALVATATAAGRLGAGRLVSTTGPLGGAHGTEHGAASRSVPSSDGAVQARDPSSWGLQAPPTDDLQRPSGVTPAPAGTHEGHGQPAAGGAGAAGAGAGALGALRIVVPGAEDRAAYWQLRAALAPEIERLAERLREVAGQHHSTAPRRFQRAGRLDRARLPAALAGREAVFMRFVQEPEPEHALCLLLDCSASMTPYAAYLRDLAILVEAAASSVGARVTAFSFGATWERMEPAAKGAPVLGLGRELRPHGGTPFGPAVQAAAEWLGHQPYRRKRLWVFSDGRWSARDRAGITWQAPYLREVVVWVLAEPAPEPPTPQMRVVAAPTLEALIEQAPRYFWPPEEKYVA